MNKLQRLTMALVMTVMCVVTAQADQSDFAAESKAPSNQTVLVSVHPMALLIKSAWPHLNVSSLVSANQSPHDFVLKPSDMKQISNVDAVIWMGPKFEPYLKKAIKGKVQIDVSQIISEDADNHKDHDHETHDEHDHDPHLWLDPDGILDILILVQMQLGLDQPKTFIDEYKIWINQAHEILKNHQQTGFVSFHDAFHEWVATFHLNQLTVVTSNPEKPVGTRHIVEVRKILASGQAQCLFVEPQFQSRIVNKLHMGLDVPVIKIDPMASTYAIDSGQFINFYQKLLSNFTQCFSN